MSIMTQLKSNAQNGHRFKNTAASRTGGYVCRCGRCYCCKVFKIHVRIHRRFPGQEKRLFS